MYGGLFGDLPEARKNKETKAGIDEGDRNDDTRQAAVAGGDQGSSSSSSMVPSAVAPTKIKQEPPSSEIVRSVGSLGTASVFIPSALNKRKRGAAGQQPAAASKQTTASTTPSSSATTTAPAQPTTQNKEVSESSTYQETTMPHTALPPTSPQKNNRLFEDSLELQQLHESVQDPYDPLVPNDLLQYWEAKSLKEHQERLEQERKRALKEQEDLRALLEREQRADSYPSRLTFPLTGRGRGVSNLPAWLVEKQKKEGAL